MKRWSSVMRAASAGASPLLIAARNWRTMEVAVGVILTNGELIHAGRQFAAHTAPLEVAGDARRQRDRGLEARALRIEPHGDFARGMRHRAEDASQFSQVRADGYAVKA